MTYDATGNILTQQTEGGPVSTYDYQTQQAGCSYYGNSVPHGPRSITSSSTGKVSYCYDANGNQAQGIVSGVVVGSVSWTSYDQPSLISTAGGGSSLFRYDGRHQRYWHAATWAGRASEKTTYVGRLLEKVVSGTGTLYRHYICAGNSMIVYVRSSSGSNATYYVMTDHLDSSNVVTDAAGALVVSENFAPLGSRRGSNWTGSPSSADMVAIGATTRHGFTGQEMMDNLGGVNMNGRVYTGLGQFMSPDRFIQDPGNTQNYNRYSYTLNNPLTFVDPSGFECAGEGENTVVVCGSRPGPGTGGLPGGRGPGGGGHGGETGSKYDSPDYKPQKQPRGSQTPGDVPPRNATFTAV